MHLKTIAKVVILLSLGLFLGSRYFNGTLAFYIHPRFNMLTVMTAVALILIAFIYAYQSWMARKDDHEPDPNAINSHHDHLHSHDLSWLGLTILAIPIVLGLVVQPKPLGAVALGNREINLGSLTSAQAPSGNLLAIVPPAGERNILDWLYLFQSSSDPAAFDGQPVQVLGFVYQDDRFSDHEFMVSRFTVSCCVADAAPVGLIVRWPDTSELLADQWVKVEGTLQAAEFNGVQMPVLVAEKVTKTEPPAQPYLFQ